MKVLFITKDGDARSVRSWSGVPFRILRELEALGAEVVCKDMAEVWHLKWTRVLFNRVIRKIVCPWREIPYEATRCSMWQTNRWLRRETRRCADFDLAIITSFSMNCTGSSLPCILIHDWTFGYRRKCLHGHNLSAAERRAENNQLQALRSAYKVVTLYPRVLDYLKGFGVDNASFICNPLNVDRQIDESEIAARAHRGARSKHFLFIGGNAYRNSLECILEAADSLGDDSVVVDVIGQTEAHYQMKCAQVNFHGYLNRDSEGQRQVYDEIFASARYLINVRKGWGGGASIAEALYVGVPVICGAYADIQALYGEDCRFGSYCEQENVKMLAEKLREGMALDEKSYVEMCLFAHNLVKDDTYRHFVASVLALKGIQSPLTSQKRREEGK